MKKFAMLCIFVLVSQSFAIAVTTKDLSMNIESLSGHFHPFAEFAGIPHPPGLVDIRLTGFWDRTDPAADESMGAIVEAGLWEGIALNIRNQDLRTSNTEVALQFLISENEERTEGMALVIENELPGMTGEANAKFETGISGVKLLWGNPLHISLHYDPNSYETELAASLVSKATERLAVILEYSSTSAANINYAYFLAALKIKVTNFMILGAGFQSPVSSDKEFNSRTLFQGEFDF